MSDLRGLIERVEKATGPDREIDMAVMKAVWLIPADAEWKRDRKGLPFSFMTRNEWETPEFAAAQDAWTVRMEAYIGSPEYYADTNGSWMRDNPPPWHGVNDEGPLPSGIVPRLTASLDAALALVEKMRPGYRWGVSSVAIKIGAHPDGKTAYGEGFRAHVTKNSPLRPMPSTADAPTPALAIILALLRSLLNTTEGGDAE